MSLRSLAPAVLWLTFVAFMSVLPGNEVPGFLLNVEDLYIHFTIYLVSAFLLYGGVSGWSRAKLPSFGAMLVIFLICIFFGGLLELAQAYLTVNRRGDWGDFMANTAGAFIGLLIAQSWHQRYRTNQKG